MYNMFIYDSYFLQMKKKLTVKLIAAQTQHYSVLKKANCFNKPNFHLFLWNSCSVSQPPA